MPKTLSCLSHVRDVKHLDAVSDILQNHQRAGRAFIHLAGENGLTLYSLAPKTARNFGFSAFKRNPGQLLALTQSHFLIHSVKILRKHGLISLIVPISVLYLLLGSLPTWMVLSLFAVSGGLFVIMTRQLFTHQRKEKQT